MINIVQKIIRNGRLIVIVDINGVREEFVTDNPVAGWLDNQIKNILNKRQSVVSYEKNIKIGSYTVPMDTPSIPTAEELKKIEFNKKLEELEKKQGFLKLGLLQESDLTTLKAEVKQLAIDTGEI